MSIKTLVASLCVLLLLGCSDQSEPEAPMHGPNSAYRSIGVVAPEHYDVWVDKFFIESLSENVGWRRPFGIVTCCWKSPPLSRAEWQTTPELFLIRWFSFAEQQSYEAVIQLENPHKIVEQMKEIAPYERYGKIFEVPRYNLVFGLAPGGTVVLWIMNGAENAIEVGRYSARKIETHPEHYREITERYKRDSQEYIDKHGIPVDDW